jgi:acyl carrier protein
MVEKIMSVSQSQEEITSRILNLLREVIPWQFAKKEIRPEMSLQSDLGIDSLGRAAFVFRMEEVFGLPFADIAPNVGDIRTVQQVLDVAIELIAQHDKPETQAAM